MRIYWRSEGRSVFDSWSISKSREACHGCSRKFRPDEKIFSLLGERGQDWVRQDFCSDCWEDVDKGALFCFWRCRHAVRGRRPAADPALVLEFFDRLANPACDTSKVFRFVLALYLLRRKELKLTGVQRVGERELMTFARRSGGVPVNVENPGLAEQQIQQASEQLSELLSAEL